MKTALIIPTLNAEKDWASALEAVDSQTMQPDRKILIDSGSTNDTVQLAEKHGFETHVIPRNTFNPGLTRQMGVNLCPEAALLIYMTQDAAPTDPQAFKTLQNCFADPNVAAAYGRHLPRPEAGPIERFKRLHNYPEQSATRTQADIPTLGLKTAFCSNSYSAWRRTALDGIGGFEETPFGEDMLAAGRLILAGRSVAYCAEATVIHSHPMKLPESFERGRKIGHLQHHHPWLKSNFACPKKAGIHYFRDGLRFLAKESPLHLPLFFFRTQAKFLGFLFGKTGVF